MAGPPALVSDECLDDSSSNINASSTIDGSGRVKKRTKTGCMTCRKRRVKCGEEKPKCSNCVKCKKPCEYGVKKSTTDEMDAMLEACDSSITMQNSDFLLDDFQQLPLESWGTENGHMDERHSRATAQSAWPSQSQFLRAANAYARRMAANQASSSAKVSSSNGLRGSGMYNNAPNQGCICQQLRQLLLGASGTPTTPETPTPTASGSLNGVDDLDYFSLLSRLSEYGDLTPESLNPQSYRANRSVSTGSQASIASMADIEHFFGPSNPEHDTLSYSDNHASCWGMPRNTEHFPWLQGFDFSD